MREALDGLDLTGLHCRRSEKWRKYPPDVLPASVAEMDYDLAGVDAIRCLATEPGDGVVICPPSAPVLITSGAG